MIDEIEYGETIGSEKFSPSDFEPKNENSNNEPVIAINKATKNNLECIDQLCKTYIKSKHTQIVKSKKMSSITRKL